MDGDQTLDQRCLARGASGANITSGARETPAIDRESVERNSGTGARAEGRGVVQWCLRLRNVVEMALRGPNFPSSVFGQLPARCFDATSPKGHHFRSPFVGHTCH
jgi:hypothetical protein